MNDEYAIEPTAFRNTADLRYVLEKFGFSEGRFVARLPTTWMADLRNQIGQLPDVEHKRAIELLRKYKKRCCFVDVRQPFDQAKPWSENVKTMHQLFAGTIYASHSPTIDDLDDEYFRPSREGRFLAKADEYARIARRLIEASGEVILIDPYFRLSQPGPINILNEFLKIGASAACRSFQIFCRYDKCCEGSGANYDRIAHDRIQLAEIRLQKGQRLQCHLVDDDGRINKMHARYLLSIKGAIRFDNGFFVQKAHDQYFDAAYMDRNNHEEQARKFIDGDHGFEVKHSLTLSA